jgi:hypothetical protein
MERRYGKAAYQPQCLADRVREARAAAKFGVIAKTGATSDVTVPGHDVRPMATKTARATTMVFATTRLRRLSYWRMRRGMM